MDVYLLLCFNWDGSTSDFGNFSREMDLHACVDRQGIDFSACALDGSRRLVALLHVLRVLFVLFYVVHQVGPRFLVLQLIVIRLYKLDGIGPPLLLDKE